MHFHVVVLRPYKTYAHSNCFLEVAEGLCAALSSLGNTVTHGENTIHSSAVNILFGVHTLSEREASGLPASSIVYNLEQLGGSQLPAWYTSLAWRLRIWDYSPLNLAQWRKGPYLHEPALVQIGFVPELARIRSAPVQDIDLLFYGSMNARRLEILKQIEADGIKLLCFFGVYGSDRDQLISRAKVVLNLHAHATEVFEIVRVSYLLANAKAVITEDSPDMGELRDAVAISSPDEISTVCRHLLADETARFGLEQRGLRLFSARRQAEILAPVAAALNISFSGNRGPATATADADSLRE